MTYPQNLETEGIPLTETPFERLRWRVGRKLGRTVYVQFGDNPADHDVLLGLFDTRYIAWHIVYVHNLWIDGQREEQ